MIDDSFIILINYFAIDRLYHTSIVGFYHNIFSNIAFILLDVIYKYRLYRSNQKSKSSHSHFDESIRREAETYLWLRSSSSDFLLFQFHSKIYPFLSSLTIKMIVILISTALVVQVCAPFKFFNPFSLYSQLSALCFVNETIRVKKTLLAQPPVVDEYHCKILCAEMATVSHSFHKLWYFSNNFTQ